MNFFDRRISLATGNTAIKQQPMVAAMIGHCPGVHNVELLRADERKLEKIFQAGFKARWEAFSQENPLPSLNDLPIPIGSFAEFDALFPKASTTEVFNQTLLGGNHAWLPGAVRDFFNGDGDMLWVIPIAEHHNTAEARNLFLPDRLPPLTRPESLRGAEIVLALADVGVLALPDFERLWVPDHLFVPVNQLIPTSTGFVRASDFVAPELNPVPPVAPPAMAAPDWLDFVTRMQHLIARFRPDLAAVINLPLNSALAKPDLDRPQLQALVNHRSNPHFEHLKRFMFVFPYIATPRGVHTAGGHILGHICASARRSGVWHSIAGRPLNRAAGVFPKISGQGLVELRDQGVSVLLDNGSGAMLDEEKTIVPAVHALDQFPDNANQYRSHVLSRFMGYLLRELSRLGDQLIFRADPQDERPRLAVERFLDRLFQAGALQGPRASDAYLVTPVLDRDNALQLDIEVKPVLPVGHIRLQFLHRDHAWRAEVVE